jgi:hypothetical protein
MSTISKINALRLPTVERYIASCPDRYFVTLTSRRAFDWITMSAEVGQVLHRVNKALFGTAYTRKDEVRLATLAVQERSFNEGLHTHMLVGVPEGQLDRKPNRPLVNPGDLIIRTWVELDPAARRAKGQDSREVWDLSGALRYSYKYVRMLSDFDNVDLDNTHIPTVPSAVPL